MTPIFLTVAEVIEIHNDQFNRYGGDTGIRDIDLLKSAVGTPAVTFGGEYLHSDLCEMAAAYLFHIVKNHPFVDGNKRTGTVCAIVFLALNGYEINAPEDDLVEMVLSVSRGEISKDAVTSFIKKKEHIFATY